MYILNFNNPKNCFTLYPAYSRVDRENLMLRNFLPTFATFCRIFRFFLLLIFFLPSVQCAKLQKIYCSLNTAWGRSWRRGTKCDCKIDWLWVGSSLEEMKYFLFTFIFSFLRSGVWRQSAALSSATQHAMPAEFCGEWGTECLNTRFPLPIIHIALMSE